MENQDKFSENDSLETTYEVSLLLFSAMQHPKNIFGQFGIIRSVAHPFLARLI